MPEILLPTASKQDSIKKTVEDIAGYFPISGGTGFFECKTNILGFGTVTSHASKLALEVSGEGKLYSIACTTKTDNPITIQIDDGPILSYFYQSQTTSSISLGVFLKFNTSLKIYKSSFSEVLASYCLE